MASVSRAVARSGEIYRNNELRQLRPDALAVGPPDPRRWSKERAASWYAALPWLVGCNFTPSYAINQLEFWQPETFDPPTIDRELGWAADLGMNSVRVYLHDLLWHADPDGFLGRIDAFLAAADRHGIRTMVVLFDSCWHPEPVLGPQPQPKPGVHNSGWVQSPGVKALADPSQHGRLRAYVTAIVSTFREDPRVLAWDVWNEPDNGPQIDACKAAVLTEKAALVAPVLAQAFGWARDSDPVQPLTSAIWLGDWSQDELLNGLQRIQIENSDVVSFHNYGKANTSASAFAGCGASGGRPCAPNIWRGPPAARSRRSCRWRRNSGSVPSAGGWCWGGRRRICRGSRSRRPGRVPTSGSTTCCIPTAARIGRRKRRSCGGSRGGRASRPRPARRPSAHRIRCIASSIGIMLWFR